VTSLCVRNLIARCRRATAIVKTSLKIHQKFISDVRFHYLVPNKSRLKRVIFPDRCRRKVQVHAFSIGFRSALTRRFTIDFWIKGHVSDPSAFLDPDPRLSNYPRNKRILRAFVRVLLLASGWRVCCFSVDSSNYYIKEQRFLRSRPCFRM
jgi:hypothetical protein